jgi:hypothetical protein
MLRCGCLTGGCFLQGQGDLYRLNLLSPRIRESEQPGVETEILAQA